MFGDGKKGKIKVIGSINHPAHPSLVNVYLVEGLKYNLISISQLCDKRLTVMFTKTECRPIDEEGRVRLSGIRTGSNCYMWRAPGVVELVIS